MADTVFHKIIRKEIPAEILHEDEVCIIIKDIQPVSPHHYLAIPKKSISSLAHVTEADAQILGHVLVVASDFAKKKNVSQTGYRLVINCGKDGGQTVDQLHVHILAGREHSWPPG